MNQLQRRIHLLLHHLEVCGNTTTLGEILTQIAGPAKNERGVFFVKKVDLSSQNETKLMLNLFFILHFTYAHPCLRAWTIRFIIIIYNNNNFAFYINNNSDCK